MFSLLHNPASVDRACAPACAGLGLVGCVTRPNRLHGCQQAGRCSHRRQAAESSPPHPASHPQTHPPQAWTWFSIPWAARCCWRRCAARAGAPASSSSALLPVRSVHRSRADGVAVRELAGAPASFHRPASPRVRRGAVWYRVRQRSKAAGAAACLLLVARGQAGEHPGALRLPELQHRCLVAGSPAHVARVPCRPHPQAARPHPLACAALTLSRTTQATSPSCPPTSCWSRTWRCTEVGRQGRAGQGWAGLRLAQVPRARHWKLDWAGRGGAGQGRAAGLGQAGRGGAALGRSAGRGQPGRAPASGQAWGTTMGVRRRQAHAAVCCRPPRPPLAKQPHSCLPRERSLLGLPPAVACCTPAPLLPPCRRPTTPRSLLGLPPVLLLPLHVAPLPDSYHLAPPVSAVYWGSYQQHDPRTFRSAEGPCVGAGRGARLHARPPRSTACTRLPALFLPTCCPRVEVPGGGGATAHAPRALFLSAAAVRHAKQAFPASRPRAGSPWRRWCGCTPRARSAPACPTSSTWRRRRTPSRCC